MTAYQLFFIQAIARMDASAVSVVMGTSPLFIALLATAVGKERISLGRLGRHRHLRGRHPPRRLRRERRHRPQLGGHGRGRPDRPGQHLLGRLHGLFEAGPRPELGLPAVGREHHPRHPGLSAVRGQGRGRGRLGGGSALAGWAAILLLRASVHLRRLRHLVQVRARRSGAPRRESTAI